MSETSAYCHPANQVLSRAVSVQVHTILIGLIILAWGISVAGGAHPIAPRPEDLFKWGANATSAVQNGQWWRLVTAMFMHSGIVHLSLNVAMLWYIGKFARHHFDQWTLLSIFMISGVVGNAVSLHLSVQDHVAVGASAAILGLIGSLLPCVWQRAANRKKERRQAIALTALVGITVALGFVRQGYDQAAHLGGLCAGIAMGVFLTRTKLPIWKTRLFGIAGGLLAALLISVSAPAAKRDMAQYFADANTWQSMQPAIEQALTRLDNDINEFKSRQISRNEMLERMESRTYPEMRKTALQLASLHLPIEEPIGQKAELMTQLTSALADLIAAEIAYSKNASLESEQKIRLLAGRVIQIRKAFVASKEAK